MRHFYLALGGVFLVLGVAGLILPLLPGVPFLLLTAFCFDRGSPRFHNWLINHEFLGPPIADWQKHGVIRLKAKIVATALILPSMIIINANTEIHLGVKVAVKVVLLSVLIFLWTRKSKVHHAPEQKPHE